MKADEYVKVARELMANPPLRSTIWENMPPEEEGPASEEDIVFEILRRLMCEVKTIADSRKANSDDAIVSIMKELRQKWFAICSRIKHPLFQDRVFDNFVAVMSKKVEHQPVRPQKKPRPRSD